MSFNDHGETTHPKLPLVFGNFVFGLIEGDPAPVDAECLVGDGIAARVGDGVEDDVRGGVGVGMHHITNLLLVDVLLTPLRDRYVGGWQVQVQVYAHEEVQEQGR